MEHTILVAAVDMFFRRFTYHHYAACRMETVSSRDKGNVAVTVFAGVGNLIGLTPSELIQYITNESVGDDVDRVLKKGEEISEPFSYSHYIMDMKLTLRSPYSGSANPSLHLWTHTIECINSSRRSINVILFSFVVQDEAIYIFRFVIYLFK